MPSCIPGLCATGDRIFTPGPKGVNGADPVSGLVPNSLLAMATNADGLALLRPTLPADMVLVEKSFSNDDVECFFSEIVRRCGYKPDTRTTEGICGSIETLRMVRMDPTKEFHAFVSVKKRYSDEDAVSEQQRVWNNGSAVSRTSPAYIKWLKPKHDKLISKIENNHTFIRQFHT
jgi:hypothetical protein